MSAKRAFAAVLAAVLTIATAGFVASAPSSAAASNPSWWSGVCDVGNNPGARPLGASFDGVQVCGPGPTQGGTDRLVRFFPGAWGEYEWECVELAMRFMYLEYGTHPYGGDGVDVVANYQASAGGGLVRIDNGTNGVAPRPGDVVSFASSTNRFGHVAVVASSSVDGNGNGSATLLSQNDTANGWRTLPVNGWRLGGFGSETPYGWLHDPQGRAGGGGSFTGSELAFQANTASLWTIGSDPHGDWAHGMAASTSPGIAALSNGSYEVAFQANTGNLWTVGSDPHGDWGAGMAAGTSPSIAGLSGGGYLVAFQANTGSLWIVGAGGASGPGDTHYGLAAGTSPAIAALSNGSYEVAFQANTGNLWTIGSDGHGDWRAGMAAGTSPSVAGLTGGGYQVAFQANTGSLWLVGAAGATSRGDTEYGMAAGTSPAIAALSNGSYELAFQANTGNLWTIGSDGHGDWRAGMAAGTSPSVAGLTGGGYQVAFQANTGSLWLVGGAGATSRGDTRYGMASGTSPCIAGGLSSSCAPGILPPSVATATLPHGAIRRPYQAVVSSSGGLAPTTWSLTSGTLPPGLTLAADGTLAGGPRRAGTWSFTVGAHDGAGRLATRDLSITIDPLAVRTLTLRPAKVGTTYSVDLLAYGGTAPLRWSVSAGALPGGTALSPTGTLSGTPTTTGTSTFTVRVVDARGKSATQQLSLSVRR